MKFPYRFSLLNSGDNGFGGVDSRPLQQSIDEDDASGAAECCTWTPLRLAPARIPEIMVLLQPRKLKRDPELYKSGERSRQNTGRTTLLFL